MSDKVCIIGAGSTGMVSAKILKEKGIAFDCFEMGSNIGGNWRYNNDNGRSAAYDSLTIDTSKDRMQFSDFPMPAEYPIFPHHSQIIRYFDAYVDHFDLRPWITFNTQVLGVCPQENGSFQVCVRHLKTGAEETRPYRAVLVCNGHHWQPKLPRFPGEFQGETTHSRHYRNPQGLAGLNVLVVGIGNSGVDIACEAAEVANRVYLSTRRGAYILPRFIKGRPIDKFVTPFSSRLPSKWQAFLLKTMIALDRGSQAKFGIPEPDFNLSAAHGTVSTELPELVRHGRITLKPNVARLKGNSVQFADDSIEKIDVIIYATGYKIAFPFFDKSFIDVEDNVFPLFRRVVPPHMPNLYFIGLIQPLGPIMPLAELQAQWVSLLLSGEAMLPPVAEMEQEIEAYQTKLRKRYVNSTRHTIQVDLFPYKRELEAEMHHGRRRARLKP